MTTLLFARLATDTIDANGHLSSLAGHHVALLGGDSLLGREVLATVESGAAGQFTLGPYRRDGSQVGSHRTMEMVVTDRAGRELPILTAQGPPTLRVQSGHLLIEDQDGDQMTLGDIVIREADARGLPVTLGTGAPVGLTQGNRLTLLADDEVFHHAAVTIRAARESVLMSQLTFSLPPAFNANPQLETTKVVIAFHTPAPTFAAPRAADQDDVRPERLLLDVADNGADVRILLHNYDIPRWIELGATALAFLFAGGSDGVHALHERLDDVTSVDEARAYFGATGRQSIHAQDLRMPLLNFGVMHARLLVVDATHCICMGASMTPNYVDTRDHLIDEPRRGASTGLPIHDVGVGLSGPGARHLYDAMKLFWDKAAPNDTLAAWPPTRPQAPRPALPPLAGLPAAPQPDGVCTTQVVRTLPEEFFGLPDGEKGILEAYLRAMAAADTLIYFETQYFTNDRIGDAIVNVIRRNPAVQVIVLVNIAPDQPFYPRKQRRLITRIRRAIATRPDGTPDPAAAARFGVFTRWTHEPGQPLPRMLPVYVHAKVGIVDDAWATVGSANLDGLSLDSCLVGEWLNRLLPFDPFGEQRAAEVNTLLLDDGGGDDIVGRLRRKLWAEHLGYPPAPANPSGLLQPPPNGWLGLWNTRSGAALGHLKTTPHLPLTVDMARVLPWPADDSTHKTPRDHLKALGIDTSQVAPLKSPPAFDFATGQWNPQRKATVDD